MPGIVFFGTSDLDRIVSFYRETFDLEIWLEQPDCTILSKDNLLLGFCERKQPDIDGTITIVTDTADAVDTYYETTASLARDEPAVNDRYQIYHYYLTDPDGRAVEVQSFLHDTDPIPA